MTTHATRALARTAISGWRGGWRGSSAVRLLERCGCSPAWRPRSRESRMPT